MENENVLDKSISSFPEKVNLIQAVVLGILAFLVPTFLAQLIVAIFGSTSVIATNSQFIVGSVVNMILVISAINIKGWKKIIGIITMPSISTLLSGYVFGTASTFMVFMIPAIWAGNFVLIYSYKFFMKKEKMNYLLAGIIGIIIKVAIIFGFFELLSVIGVFPEKISNVLQVAMGTNQLITATIGVTLAYAVYIFEKRKATK